MSDSIAHRTCKKCSTSYPLTPEFWHKNKKTKEGLSYSCKECAKARALNWHYDNHERAKMRHHDYYQRNRPYLDAKNRLWALNHPERIKGIQESYKKRHPGRRLEASRKWHENNRERERKSSAAYRKNNPDKTKAYWHKRRALERSAEGSFTAEDVRIAYRSQKGKCWHCGHKVGETFHADHLIPLKHGGTNWPNNIVVSCKDCNLRKGSKLCYQWNKRLF